MEQNRFGYPFFEESDVKIQYNIDLLDMRNANNNVFILLLLAYLKSHGDPFGRVKLSLNELVIETGYYTKSKSKTYHSYYRDAIQRFIEEDILLVDEDFDILSVKNSDYFTVKLNKDNDIYYVESVFVILTVEELNKILNSDSNLKSGILLNTYLLFKKYAFIGERDELIYPKKATLTKELGVLSPTTTEKAINALIDVGLIFKDKPYFVKNKSNQDTYVQLRNIYSLSPDNFRYTKHKLEQIYEDKVYSIDDIDKEKIVRLSKRH